MKAVIFDCDGVLINTEELGAYSLKKLFNRGGVPFSSEYRIERYAGVSEAQMKKQIKEDFNAVANSRSGISKLVTRARQKWAVHGMREKYMAYVEKNIAVNEGVIECLEALKSANIPFCVASNSDHAMLEAKLKKVGLYDYFAGRIFSSDMVANPKPAPDLFLYAAAQMGVSPEDCAIVDDSVPGVTAGNSARGYTIGFTGGEKERPDLVGIHLLKSGADELADSMLKLKDRFLSLLGISGAGPAPPQP